MEETAKSISYLQNKIDKIDKIMNDLKDSSSNNSKISIKKHKKYSEIIISIKHIFGFSYCDSHEGYIKYKFSVDNSTIEDTLKQLKNNYKKDQEKMIQNLIDLEIKNSEEDIYE